MEIPNGPETMTAKWLTQALRQTGTIKNANVLSFQIQPVSEDGENGIGITGQMAKIKPIYDLNEPEAPHSIIAKFHSADLQKRAIANMLGLYENEFLFYQHFAGQSGLPTPRCYYCDFHESGLTVLLLEDLAPAHTMGKNAEHYKVEIAIQQIAKFHAAWWEHAGLVDMVRKEDPADRQQLNATLQANVQQNWAYILETAGDILPEPMKAIGQRIVNSWASIIHQIRNQPPQTLIHGDFGGNNIFFATPEGGAPFTVIDWQLSTRGKGVYDVGMLVGSLPTDYRRKTEMSLLKMYHQILVENGVKDYSFEQCLDDYRLTALDCFARLVLVIRAATPDEDLNQYRLTDHKFRKVELPRRCAAILDLNADTLLPA